MILVVEDESALRDVLSYNLTKEGFDCITASDGASAIVKAKSQGPDLIILDLMLPVLGGYEVCRQLREFPETRQTPVLMLTAKDQEHDEVNGFQSGADDYVTKPFRVQPLIQRVRALLRRGRVGDPSDRIHQAGLAIDRVRHRATIDGRELSLTPTEFKLLLALARQPGRAFSRQELMDAALGEDALSLDRTIDVHIKSLRDKLADRNDLIETVRGVGYRFRDRVPVTS
jgi:two-component system phosphate regulon response regulator PhoB